LTEFDRNQGLGGSDATRLYQGEWYELWQEKTGATEPADLSDVLPVQMGIHTESFNIDWFTKQTGLEVHGKQETFFHPKYKFMYAHVDGLIMPNPKNKEDMKIGVSILECKHTNAFSNPKKIADKYKAQIQHYLMCASAKRCYVSVFFGNMKYEVMEITEDKDFQDQLENAEILFWHFVQKKKAPPEYIGFENFNSKEFTNGETIIPILPRE
jgi:predicted phage-related endonuclease